MMGTGTFEGAVHSNTKHRVIRFDREQLRKLFEGIGRIARPAVVVVAALALLVWSAPARAAIEFHFEVGTIHSVGDCDGWLNDSDPYFIYRVGSSGTSDYRTNECGGCGGDAVFNQWWTHTVTSAVDKIRARVRDYDGDYDPWGSCSGDCDSNLGGSDLTLYDNNTWYSQWTSTSYSDGYGGDVDDDCPDTVQIDYRNYYCDNDGPSAPSSLTVTQSGNIYGSLSSTYASWGTASDAHSGIYNYEYCIGTTAGGCEVVGWTSTGTTRNATVNYSFPQGRYYWSVRAKNNNLTTFSKVLRDCSGNNPNYHTAGSVRTDTTGFAVDKTGPTLHHYQTISRTHSTGSNCETTILYPLSGDYGVTPTHARVHFSNVERKDMIGYDADELKFWNGGSLLANWGNENCSSGICYDCHEPGDGWSNSIWSPWDPNSQIGLQLCDHGSACSSPTYTIDKYEYDRTYGWYRTDPGSTVAVSAYANSETTTFDDSASNRMNIDYIQIDKGCDNSGWVTVWNGSADSVGTFNPWSNTDEGEFAYCVRACDEGGNCETEFDSTSIKAKFWYRKDSTPPTGASIAHTDGYETDTTLALTFNKGTDALSGVATWKIQYRSSPLSLNVCTGYGGWNDLITDPPGTSYNHVGVTSGYCYQYRIIVTDGIGNAATFQSDDTTKVDTSASTGGSITYSDGYPASPPVSSVSVTLGNGNDPQSDIGTRYLQRREATLTDNTCGAFGSWSSIDTNPALNYSDTTIATGKCYQYRYLVYNNASLVSTYCTDGTSCSTLNTVKIDNTAPVLGTIDASNFEYGIYVSSPFTLSIDATDGQSTVANCEYTKDNGTNWYAADSLCNHRVTCTDGQALQLKLRATNESGLTTTSSMLERTCDTPKPSTADDWTDDWTNSGSVNVTLSILDGGSGMSGGEAGTWYCTDTTNTCTPTTSYSTPVNFSCSSGSVCVRYIRYYSKDAVGNTEDVNSERIRQDLQKPDTVDDWTNNCSSSASPQSPVGIYLIPDDASGSGMSGGSAQTLYCVDTSNTCTPDTAATYVQVTCAYGSQCTQYVRYRSTDYAGNVEATINSNCVYQDIHQPEWIDQWDPGDDTAAGATTLVPTENTVNTHGPHSLNNYSVNTDNYDWFSMSLTTGRRYCFNSIGGIGNVRAQLCSDTSCSSVVASDDNSGGYEQFSFCYTPSSAGTYYLRLYGNPVGEVWYGDVNYWYTTIQSGAPSATTNSSDSSTVTATRINNAPSGGDEWWPCNNGDPDWYALVCLNGSCAGSESNRVEDHGLVNIVDVTKTVNVGRTETPTTLIEIWDYDNCSGNDLYTCRTWNSAIPTASAWNTLYNCGESNPNQVEISNSYVDDKGVAAATGLTVSPTTDTGMNGDFDFSWTAVSDRSGISAYWFQLATDSGFSNLIMTKNMGSSTSVTMGYGVLTPSTTYYWRVGAVSNCTYSSPSKRCNGAYSNATHVSWTSAQSFSMTDDDVTQPDAGNLSPLSSTIYDSNTNYSVFIDTGPHTRTGDDQSETFTCINTGLKSCSMFFAQEPLSGSNTFDWDSGYRTSDAASAPSGIEIDEADATRNGSQIHWYLEDYSTFGEQDTIALGDGDGDWEEVTLPAFTAATVDRAGKEDYFNIDRMIVKVSLQTTLDEWCSVIWPFSCNPNQTELSMTIQTRRHNGTSWDSWTTRQTVSGEHAWTTREFTLLDTTNSTTINSWNTGANKIDVRILLSGTIGANVIETEMVEFYARYAKVTASYDWHINSHSAVQFIPLTQLLGTPIEFVCSLEDDDNDRGANKDCSPASSLDVDYDCVTGEGSTGRSGSCTALNYTVVDDDDTAPSVTLDAPDYINAGPVDLEAGASDPTQGDEYGVSFVKFQYAPYSGGCGSYTDLATDSGDPDCDPSYCITTWSTLPSDGRYCIKAIARDKDDDRANDWLEGYAVDDNVIVDRQAPNNTTLQYVREGTCAGTDLPNDTWQGIGSDPCFQWNAATDNGLSGVADYWVYYGSKCSGVTDGDGGYIGNTLSWTNDVGPGEGTFCFWMKVKDNAGNESSIVKLWTIKYDATPPVFTSIDADNVEYTTFVDGTFDLSADVGDAASKLKDNTCEYQCAGDGGLCDGTWRSASDNWSGTDTSSGACSATNITCTTNLAGITLRMRVDDNAGMEGDSQTDLGLLNRTCDIMPPTNTSIGPGADVYENSTTVSNSGAGLSCSDGAGESGVHDSSAYDIEICNDGASKGGCTTAGTWVDGNTVDWGANDWDSLTGADGNWYRFRGRCRDNVENATADVDSYAYSTGYVLVDTQAPNDISACSSITLLDQAAGTALTWGQPYTFEAPSKPYMQWSSPGDAGTNGSGVEGYYVYFGANSSADPETDGTWQTGLNFTNTIDMTSGTNYYFKIQVKDRAGNVSASSPACEYVYSTGAYLHISQIDAAATSYGGVNGSTDDPEGVLAPDDSDYEIIILQLLDEYDNLIRDASSKSVTVALGNLGSTGAYISETHAGTTTGSPTSVNVNLVQGQGWVKVKAAGSEDPDAITVTPSASGLTGVGGHDQVVYLLVRDDTTMGWEIDTSVDDFATAETNDLIINPVWSHSGDKIAYMTHAGGTWNIYMKEYSGSWGSAIRLTGDSMNVHAHAAFSFTGDDSAVVFSANNDADGNEPELFAVTTSNNGALGDDAGKTLATLRSETKLLTAATYSTAARRRWSDADWSNTTCGNGYGDSIVSAMAHIDNGTIKGADLFVVNGSKTGGLYVEESGASVTQITNFPESPQLQYVMHPRWSHDCSKVVFTLVDGVFPATGAYSKAGIYVLNLTDSSWGSVASLPVTSTSDTGLYLIHECTSSTCSDNPAVFPSFSADDTFVIYAVDTTHTFNIRGLQQDDIKGEFYTGKNFDNYAVYIQNQPNYVSQLIGQSANNEFALTQCAGASCPDSADGNPFVFVTQSSATQGDLRLMYLGTESAVTDAGGLMFIDGAVAAVIPPGALNAETMLEVEDNESFSAPSSPDGEALLVDTGIAREFFPDGVIFDEDVLLVFHYCDTDGDGYLDNRQNTDCSGATGGNSALDENKLYVYYWCDATTGTSRNCTDNTWEKLNGAIDPSKNMITVATNHFSRYDVKALMRGLAAPQVIRELHLSNPHTYPNPWHIGDGMVYFNIDGDSSFNTQAEGTAGNLQVTVSIYDIRGKHVKTIHNTLAGLATLAGAVDGSLSSSGRGIDLASWDVTNNAGRNVASGVYLYHISVSDGVYSRDVTGKLAVVR